MLSYQHAFHAGNHADVVKHATLCTLIRALSVKNKPFFYLDTHAGNGCYDITTDNQVDEVTALQLVQSASACADLPNAINDYIALITPYLSKATYPGSPLVVWDMLNLLAREKGLDEDSFDHVNLQLSELHPTAFGDVKQLTRSTSFSCHQRDGLERLNALTPPNPKRGLVMIDPPYEQAKEYDDVVAAITKSLKKWQNGIYCIWYPLLSPSRIDRTSSQIVDTPKHGFSENMLTSFTALAKQHNIGLINVEFAQHAPSPNVGMYGSGMVMFNPPWQIDKALSDILEHLLSHVAGSQSKFSAVSVLVPSL